MEEEIYLICEDSLEGIFTGIYDAYLWKKPLEQMHLLLEEDENYRLFAVYQTCKPDIEKVRKVSSRIIRSFGRDTYYCFCQAMASREKDKADAVFHAVVEGLRMDDKRNILGNLSNPDIYRVFQLSRNVGKEAHAYIEFLRFRELKSGLLFAEIEPKNNIITFIIPHFADRLPLENFVICDVGRQIFAVHEAKKEWFLVYGVEKLATIKDKLSDKEEHYGELFRDFFHTISIKERKNCGLQMNMLPLRYREYMTEFQQIARK